MTMPQAGVHGGPVTQRFFPVGGAGVVPDLVSCGECATRYDSDSNAFCPRCGSTDRSKPVPGALQVAARHDPARRRVQASGVLLLVAGGLFLVSALIGLTIPAQQLAQEFVTPMADQPGGTVILVPEGNATYAATVTAMDGQVLGNASGQIGEWRLALPDHASVHVAWVVGGQSGNVTAIVLTGDTLRIPLDTQDELLLGSTLQTTITVGRVVFVAVAAVLVGGGLCALLLRVWALAAAAAIAGLLLGLLAVAGFLLAGLLFALPFGFAAVFILRGRRHFRAAKPRL